MRFLSDLTSDRGVHRSSRDTHRVNLCIIAAAPNSYSLRSLKNASFYHTRGAPGKFGVPGELGIALDTTTQRLPIEVMSKSRLTSTNQRELDRVAVRLTDLSFTAAVTGHEQVVSTYIQ
jgi:hypothetical protein